MPLLFPNEFARSPANEKTKTAFLIESLLFSSDPVVLRPRDPGTHHEARRSLP